MNATLSQLDLAVVGGGAAGFFAALALAEARPASRILILEKGSALLSKVRVSGGGRCNVTHNCFDPQLLVQNYPRGGPALRGAFHRFQPADTLRWFEDRGVALKTEADGRIFPASDSAETVIRCFLDEADRLGIAVRLRSPVERIAVTAAVDATDDANAVLPEERDAFLEGLADADASFTYHERLEDAIAEIVPLGHPSDLVLLLGAQGMNRGAELALRRLGRA